MDSSKILLGACSRIQHRCCSIFKESGQHSKSKPIHLQNQSHAIFSIHSENSLIEIWKTPSITGLAENISTPVTLKSVGFELAKNLQVPHGLIKCFLHLDIVCLAARYSSDVCRNRTKPIISTSPLILFLPPNTFNPFTFQHNTKKQMNPYILACLIN